MSVQFAYGRPGEAMNDYLDELAAAPAREDPTKPVYVVTERQYTYGTEAEICETRGGSGSLGLQVTSFDGLARDILQNVYGGALEFVDAPGMSMLIRRILDDRRDELAAFRSISTDSALPSQIAKQLRMFKSMDISPENLRAYAARRPGNARVQDLALVYEELEARMKNRRDENGRPLADRIDADDMVNIAISHVDEAWFLDGSMVILRGFDDWTAQQIRFAEALINNPGIERIVVELPRADAGEPDYPIYFAGMRAAERLLPAAEKRGVEFVRVDETKGACPADVRHVAKRLFSYDRGRRAAFEHMTIDEYRDAEEEIRSVAAEIVRLRLEEGVAFGDMAIVWGETREYEPLIRRVFSEARIPYFSGEKKTLADGNLAEFVLTAVELAHGALSKDAVLAHAATGFTDLTSTEAAALSNYAYSHVSWGRQFTKEFTLPEKGGARFKDRLDIAEEARGKLMDPILKILRKGDGARTTVSETLDRLEKYMRTMLTANRIESKAKDMATEYEQVSFMEQSAKAIMSIISKARELLGDMPLDRHDLRRILRAGFEAVSLSLVPPALDEVQAGPIMTTYVRKVRALFIIGVNDEVLPRFTETMTDILTPAEWSDLVEEQYGYPLNSDIDAQKFRITRVLYQATGRVYWSCHLGGRTRPSVLIRYLEDLREGDVDGPSLKDHLLSLKENAYNEAVREIRAAADGGPAPDARLAASVLFDPRFRDRTAQLGLNITRKNEARRAPSRFSSPIFSATRLQTMGACPYKHFLTYQVGAWEPVSTFVDHRGTGNFMHGVLDGIVEDAGKSGAPRWSDIPEADFAKIVARNVASVSEAVIGEEPVPRNRARLEALIPRIEEAARIIRRQQELGCLRPLAAEYEFSIGSPESGAVRGFIDRIDIQELNGRRYLSLVDYKSSEHPFSLGRLEQGTDLQLIIYLLALEELIRNGTTVNGIQLLPSDIVAGAGFMNLAPKPGRKEPDSLLAPYRMDGILGVPPDVGARLYGMDGGSLAGINASVTKEGAYYKSAQWRIFSPWNEAGGKTEFDALLDYGRARVRSLAERSQRGENQISPARSGAGLECRLCPYVSVCRFEPETMGEAVRRPPEEGNEEIRARIVTFSGTESPSMDRDICARRIS